MQKRLPVSGYSAASSLVLVRGGKSSFCTASGKANPKTRRLKLRVSKRMDVLGT